MLLSDWRDKINNVPYESTDGACGFCLGVCNPGYSNCYKCANDWLVQNSAIQRVCDLILPCTVAVSPSEWYNVMRQYKRGSRQQSYTNLVATVLHVWLKVHWGKLADALGDTPTVVIAVPSRSAAPPAPLQYIVEVQPLFEDLVNSCAIRYCEQAGTQWKRKRLDSDAFVVDHQIISDQCVILVEDTWVTGSTALSAALAVRRAGAKRLALISIARMVYEDAMSDDYRELSAPPWDTERFPRA